MTPSTDGQTALRLLQGEAARAEHAAATGEHFAPFVLINEDASRYVRRRPDGAVVLEPLTAALTGAVRITDREQSQARAGAFNGLLSPDQRAAGASVQAIHERVVLNHIAAAARMLIDRLKVAA